MDAIRWADRIVWVYPLWWGFMPALLKGFIDQVLAQPDFASTYGKYGMPVGLLGPRRSTLIVTMDAPVSWERLFKRDRGIGVLIHSILKLCGIKVDRTMRIGDMFESTPAHREKALERVEEAGRLEARR
jgi:putative NADPH-quinone reductase